MCAVNGETPTDDVEKQEGEVSELEDTVSDQDVEVLKKALTEEKARAEQHLANWQRAQADFVNLKRRTDLDKEETSKFANAALMVSLLPVVDDLERALNSAPTHKTDHAWVEGIKHIHRKFRSVLEAQGLQDIKAVGQPFDPKLHEAVMKAPGESGIVLKELQKGFRLKDRVIRPSLVVVGDGSEEEQSQNQDESKGE